MKRILFQIDKKFSFYFVTWLLRRYKLEIMSELNFNNTKVFIEYVDKIYNIKIDPYRLMKLFFNTIEVSITKDKFEIYTNTKYLYDKTDITIYGLVTLFEYGNLDIKGSNIIGNITENIIDNIDNYYRMYNPNYIIRS